MEENKAKGLHDEYRSKLKEKYINEGMSSFEQHEILELLLFYAVSKKDTCDIAHNLIHSCGSLSAIFDAPIDILTQNGLSQSAAFLIHMISDLSRIYQSDKFDSEKKTVTNENVNQKIIGLFAGKDEENVYAIFFDAKGKEKYSGIISKGDVSTAPIFTKDIVSIAVRHKAVSVILAHNHPSGFAFPSKADLEVTKELAALLRTLGIKLVDHIIVADNNYISLASIEPFSTLFEDSYCEEN